MDESLTSGCVPPNMTLLYESVVLFYINGFKLTTQDPENPSNKLVLIWTSR